MLKSSGKDMNLVHNVPQKTLMGIKLMHTLKNKRKRRTSYKSGYIGITNGVHNIVSRKEPTCVTQS